MPNTHRTRHTPADLTPSLVASLHAGAVEAGALLDRLYRQAMIRFCWAYLRSVEQAEDATQDIFCKVLRSKEVPDNFRAWLYRVARNHCLNLRRARGRRHDQHLLPSDSQLEAHFTGPSTRLGKQELRSRINHLLNALPASQREVLQLRYVEELSRAEISYVLGIRESVVKSRLFEGLKKLREHTSLLDEQ